MRQCSKLDKGGADRPPLCSVAASSAKTRESMEVKLAMKWSCRPGFLSAARVLGNLSRLRALQGRETRRGRGKTCAFNRAVMTSSATQWTATFQGKRPLQKGTDVYQEQENLWSDWKLYNNIVDLLSSNKVGFGTNGSEKNADRRKRANSSFNGSPVRNRACWTTEAFGGSRNSYFRALHSSLMSSTTIRRDTTMAVSFSQVSLSPTAKLKIRSFTKGCRESGTNLIFLHRWGGKVDSRRFVTVVWNERCPFSCFRHFFGFGCHNHSNSLPMYVAPRWSTAEYCAFAAFFDAPLRNWWET